MLEIIMLRFDAPLMSFGAPVVDNYGVIQQFPGLSMITGLLANALGYDHADFSMTEALQERLRYASRADRAGRRVQDYQTVALGQPHLLDKRGWTTRGQLDKRAGANSKRTHIRYRDYWADAIHTVAVTLEDADYGPSTDDLERALRYPERPLFIGRKPCLPAAPLLLGRTRAPSLRKALERWPLADRADAAESVSAWWPHDDPRQPAPTGTRRIPTTDRRDWRNQIHVGERQVLQGQIEVGPKERRHG